jgi:hypothetical protein
VPEADTVMDCVVDPVDHTLLLVEEDVSVTVPPWQNVVVPLVVTVGVVGNAITLIVAEAEAADEQPKLLITETR